MHSSNQQHLLTMRLFGLFLKCPFGQATSDCPFTDIRAMASLELKFQLAERMASQLGCQENVRATHEVCFRRRLRMAKEGQGAPPFPSQQNSLRHPCSHAFSCR